MSNKNYYDILGVKKEASQDEIKKSYRKLAHQHHPDKGNGDDKKFKEINEAYQTLGNKDKRAQYDRFGSAFNNAGGFSGFGGQGFNWQDFSRANQGGFRTNFNFDDLGDLGDIFGDLFGGGLGGFGRRSSHTQSQTGEDIQIQMEIDFREAVFGVEKNIRLDKMETCQKCKGKGYKDKTKIITCLQCNGQGKIRQNTRTIFGTFATEAVCPTCHGQGKKPESFCNQCHGQGRIKNKKEIKITIPAGISEGETIRVSGQGNAGSKNSRAGDLYVSFKIKPDKEFVRENYDILSEIKINISQAALGGKIQVNTLDGSVKLKIPAGTQSGKVFVLKNKGVPVLNRQGSRGDQQIKIIVQTPKNLSRKSKKLLEDLEKEI